MRYRVGDKVLVYATVTREPGEDEKLYRLKDANDCVIWEMGSQIAGLIERGENR